MGKDNHVLVKLAQALTFKVEHIYSGRNFAGHWQGTSPFNRLVYIFRESITPSSVSDGRQTVKMEPGRWMFIPAGCMVEHDQYDEMELISIHFSILYYSNPGIISAGPELYHGKAPESMTDFKLLADTTVPGVIEVIHLQKLLCSFMIPILKKEKKDLDRYLSDLQTFQTLFDIFQKDMHCNFSVSDMAKIMKMGNETFVKKFKLCMNTSPKKFFNRLRATAAASQLRPPVTIREVADEFGFANEFYFSRFFKKHLGMSPREWRDNTNMRT